MLPSNSRKECSKCVSGVDDLAASICQALHIGEQQTDTLKLLVNLNAAAMVLLGVTPLLMCLCHLADGDKGVTMMAAMQFVTRLLAAAGPGRHCPPRHPPTQGSVKWHHVTRRAISTWSIARHVIGTHSEPLFLELNGIL